MISLPQNHTGSNHTNVDDLSTMAASASEIAREAQGRLAEAGEIVKSAIINRPVLALGAALAAGVFLGWMIKRR